jgi:drug/metabolite transporter (DMT)-like permease
VVATVLLAWLVIFDFPDGASREAGVYLALIGAMAIAGGSGDYATLRGAPLFPKTTPGSGRQEN